MSSHKYDYNLIFDSTTIEILEAFFNYDSEAKILQILYGNPQRFALIIDEYDSQIIKQ